VKCLVAMLLSIAFSSLPSHHAQASEWGCEVLLCAASSNPSWHGVETCHPPMEKLILAMKTPGFSWPTCPEGGAGKPGYVKYANCPAGWAPAAGDDPRDKGFSGEASRCTRQVMTCRGGRGFSRFTGKGYTETMADGVTRVYAGDSSCVYTEYKPRALPSEPHYFDIKDEATGQPNRFWFDLQK
jgi:hypothetical protein